MRAVIWGRRRGCKVESGRQQVTACMGWLMVYRNLVEVWFIGVLPVLEGGEADSGGGGYQAVAL